VPIPNDTWEVGTPNPEITAIYPFAEVWRRAQHYILANNEGSSVTIDGPLFDQSKLAHGQEPSVVIEPRGALTMKMLPPTSSNFTPVKATTREATNAAYIRIGNAMAPPQQAPGAGGWIEGPELNQASPSSNGGGGLLANDDNLERLVKAMAHGARSPEITERNKTQEKVVHRYMLAFATVKKNGEEETVSPAKLKPGFIEMIKCTNLNAAKSLWNDMLNQACQIASDSTERRDGGITIQADDLSDGAFVAALREFKFLRKPLNTASAMTEAKTHISILVFADPLKEAKAYKDRLLHEQLINCQEAVGEEKNKMARKSTDLYNGGALFHVDNVKTLIFNLRLFGRTISDDFEDSELWKNLEAFENYLHKNVGRDWAEILSKKYRHAALSMAIDLHNVIRQYFAIGDVLEYRDAVANGSQLHPRTYKLAGAVGNDVVSKLYTAIGSMKYGEYGETPEIAYLLPHLGISDDRKTPAQIVPFNGTPPGKHNIAPDKGGHNGNEANKRGKKEPDVNKGEPREDREVEKTIGFLTWNGTGFAPKYCQVFVKTRDMKTKERICLWYSIQGMFCGRAKDSCRQGHIKSFTVLSNEEQKKMEAFVKDTPGLEFVTGQGPKGMT
jgi:hypothetical protein